MAKVKYADTIKLMKIDTLLEKGIIHKSAYSLGMSKNVIERYPYFFISKDDYGKPFRCFISKIMLEDWEINRYVTEKRKQGRFAASSPSGEWEYHESLVLHIVQKFK